MSRIGKKPVDLPSGVEAKVSGQTVEVKGPKGTRSFTATDDVTITLDGNVITVKPRGNSKRARQQWGMSRTMVANLVTGVTDRLQARARDPGRRLPRPDAGQHAEAEPRSQP